ncbi:pyruvate kinase [Salinibacterium sp. CAN_S4]|uniref:pyruvate kinase n=1 Tax=Salinibacterium sp. CAN_S4 TaxID=2787727 RepID=UPI0018EFC98F
MDVPSMSLALPGHGVDDLTALLRELENLRQSLLDAEERECASIEAVMARHRPSAINLVHYVELRSHDIRELQERLTGYGLSSLGRTESHVMPGIDAVIRTLKQLTGHRAGQRQGPVRVPSAGVLTRNAVSLLGAHPKDRPTRIMVTFPSEAATDCALVTTMLSSGMDIARINCAHDDADAWSAMIRNVRAAEAELGKSCLISMDLAGPKLRTGPLVPRAQVVKVKPERDERGMVVTPAAVWFGEAPAGASGILIPVIDPAWAARRTVGQRIHLVDARGSHRVLTVEQVHGTGCLVSFRRTIYFEPGTRLRARVSGGERHGAELVTRVGALPSRAGSITARRGDLIRLMADLTPAEVTDGPVHSIGVTLFEVFADTEPGDRVLIDDGKISTVITEVTPDIVTVEVHNAGVAGMKLRAEKGINLPDSTLTLSALTAKDVDDLAFVRTHADIVELSFVRSAADVDELLVRLDPTTDAALGIVLKIETVAAFDSLPQILLEAMRWGDIGVMIARGDLAVEAGFERLAELQEEILWLAEAAHVPVIWATEVLDDMARTGVPSRPEVTDAAMAQRAECVMLNKGPYIGETITMLADILHRMQRHMAKKRSLLQRLSAWDLNRAVDTTAPSSSNRHAPDARITVR